ncbi:MAG: T9SS type A sorting domain-containing protein [Bacteroidota bacterium]
MSPSITSTARMRTLILLAFLIPSVALAQVNYPANGNTGFGGTLGTGSFDIRDDGTTVTLTLNRGSDNLDNVVVVYLDVVTGGFASTANFTDAADGGRRAISGTDGPNRTLVNFPTGFTADYAVTIESAFSGVFELVESGSHNFITSANLDPTGNPSAATFTIDFDFSEIGLTANTTNTIDFVATYISGTAFRSDEAVGDGVGPGNPESNGTITFTSGRTYVSSPSSAQTLGDGAGWRMLAVPSTAVVSNLSSQNLVQGVTGQYPTEDQNIYVARDWSGAAWATGNVADGTALPSGEGFIWYFFDNDLDPTDPTGTSNSVALPSLLTAPGAEPVSDVTVDYALADFTPPDNFYLLGNPFDQPIEVADISVSSDPTPGINNDVQVYDPAISNYQVLSRSAGDNAQVWQGVFVQLSGTPAGPITFTIPTTAQTTDGTFYGRQGASDLGSVGFQLAGTGSGAFEGRTTTDVAAFFRIAEDATFAFDVFDSSKLYPLTGTYGLIGFVGAYENGDKLQTSYSVPREPGAYSVPLQLVTSIEGQFELTWPTWENVPETWSFTLRDLETGAEVDLRTATSYTFEAGVTPGVASANEQVGLLPETAGRSVQRSEATDTRFELVVEANATAAEDDSTPQAAILAGVYPNPFAGQAQIDYTLGRSEQTRLAVYDVLGREVALLQEGTLAAGSHTATFDAARLPSGLYLVRLEVGNQVLTSTVMHTR